MAGTIDLHSDTPVILIADGDADSRAMLRSMMEAEGYTVEEATNGLDALNKYASLRPDVLLLDAATPALSGLEVCAQLQTVYSEDYLPIIVLASRDDQQTIDKAFALGAGDYVTKPIHKPLLRHRVRYLLENARLARELEEERSRLRRLVESSSNPARRKVDEGQGPSVPDANARTAELLAANDVLQQEIVARHQAEKRQTALITGLRMIIGVADELLTATSGDMFCRRAVELAREKLGVERCAIFLSRGDAWHGTYGTDDHGNTTDERAAHFSKTEGWLQGFGTLTPYEQQWIRRDAPHQHFEGDKVAQVGYGWISVTRLRSAQKEIGIFFNDCAISQSDIDPIQQEIVSMYCSVLGNIFERKSIEETLQQKTAYLAALNEATVELVRRLDAQAALESIIHRASALVGAPHGYLFVLEPGTQEPVVRVGTGAFENWIGYRLTTGDGLAGQAWKTGEIVAVDDYSQWPGRQPDFDWLRASVCLPLRSGSDVVGILGLAYGQIERTFGGEEIEILTRFGELASVALQNSRLYAEVQQELSERKRIEESLRQSEERYRRLFDQIEDTIFIHDLHGHILDVNEAASLRLGYSRDILLQMTIADIDTDELWHGFEERVRQQLSAGKLNNIQGQHRTRDGRLIDVEVNTTVINYNGQQAVLAVSRDATEQRRVEQQLRHLSQLKTEFLSTAAHELRTPLTTIQGFSELLLTRALTDDRRQRYLSLVNEQATELGKIIDDLLDISRLEAKGKLTLSLEPINMSELIVQVVTPYMEASPTHPIQLECVPECPPVYGDRFRLGQVIKNLLSNAIKYSPDGGQIVVRNEVRGDQVNIVVQDQGIGMSPEQQSHLFEEFYRANATNTAIGGTGLGLAICKKIIALHGGAIWAESEPQVGTRFHFSLPVQPGPSRRVVPATRPQSTLM